MLKNLHVHVQLPRIVINCAHAEDSTHVIMNNRLNFGGDLMPRVDTLYQVWGGNYTQFTPYYIDHNVYNHIGVVNNTAYFEQVSDDVLVIGIVEPGRFVIDFIFILDFFCSLLPMCLSNFQHNNTAVKYFSCRSSGLYHTDNVSHLCIFYGC